MSEKSGFRKTSSVVTIAVATNNGDSFQKSAAYKEDINSAFLSGTKTIDIKAALNIVAKEYNISSNPEDYIFEAIRGNTSNVPNENSDGFHKTELLRFDHRLSKQVYRTYELKPHHINHRAENAKNARGFVLDVHYNDSTPPLDVCPNPECGAKTADRGSRDAETGIHCIKCGAVVKDEFVELLVAIDKVKDPTFAQGVLTGILKHGSMGCSCLRTRCNVCGNVAYTRSEFCAHIRNKGKEYDESEPKFNPIAFIIKYKDKTASKSHKTAKAFEWCEGVIFDEYSRVHDPADLKAEQSEILQISTKVADIEKDEKLRNESELLTIQARLVELERKVSEKMSKAAQKDSDVHINITEPTAGPEDVEITSETPLEESPAAGIPLEEMTPESEGATPAGPGEALTPEAMGIMPEGVPPPAPPRRGASVEDNITEAFNDLGGPSMLRFANSYKHIKAEITSTGNIRIFDNKGTMFVVKPERVANDSKAANKKDTELAKTVLTMIADHGIGGTIKRTNAIVGPRLAQVLEYALDDMKDKERGKTDSVLDETETDTEEKRTDGEVSLTEAGSETDRKEEYDTKGLKDNALVDRDTDVEDEERNIQDPTSLLKGDGGAVSKQESDTRPKRKDWDLGQSAVDDVTLDNKEKTAETKTETKAEKTANKPDAAKEPVKEEQSKYAAKQHAARIEAIYRSRLEKKVAELEGEKETYKKNLRERLAKAMKLVAHRQALNLEYSPLKTAMGIALCNPRPLDEEHDYEPMDQKTAVFLVEAAFNDQIIEGTDKSAWESQIDGLINRASSIMEMSDESLTQIEADLNNVKVAAVPFDDTVRPHEVNSELRSEARMGNLQLTSSGNDRTQARDVKRDEIRRAVGVTRVANLANVRN